MGTSQTDYGIRQLLTHAKNTTGAGDVRFRVRDWKDESIVYVPKWIVGKVLDQAEPVLAQRFYNRSCAAEPCFDCYVGFKAMQSRLKEEEKRAEEKQHNQCLIIKLGDVEKRYGIDREKFLFDYRELEKTGRNEIFEAFLKELERRRDECKQRESYWKILQQKWTADSGSRLCDNRETLSQFIVENVSNLQQRERWLAVVEYLGNVQEDRKEARKRKEAIRSFLRLRRDEGENFLRHAFGKILERTRETYERLHEQWREYTKFTGKLGCEIAVPVVDFDGRLLGVLNLHQNKASKKKAFGEEEVKTAKECAVELAEKAMQRQLHQYAHLQAVTRRIAAGITSKEIASEISKRVREVLEPALENTKVFPLLHVPRRPIRRDEDLNQVMKQWEQLWVNSYYGRKKPDEKRQKQDHDLWAEEELLGTTPIRSRGLGEEIITRWKEGLGARDHPLFVEELFVDNLEHNGSIAAHFNGVKTTGCLALTYGTELYGLLYIHCKDRHFFTNTEVNTLTALADQAAIVIRSTALIGKSYEDSYGGKVLEQLDGLKFQKSSFRTIIQILKEWATEIKGVRGSQIVDTTLRAVSEICEKRAVGLPRGFLEYYVSEYYARESALQSIQSIREHFVHPFHVFLLGFVILAKWKDDQPERLRNFFGDVPEKEVLKQWFVACIYHDVGYPGQMMLALISDMFEKAVGRKVSGQINWGPVVIAYDNYEHVEKLAECYAKHFGESSSGKEREFKKWFYYRLLEENDHGAFSALVLLNRWDEAKKRPDDSVYESALAIALHNRRERQNQSKTEEARLGCLQVERFPLAFLLQYCDTAQESGRRVYHRQRRLSDLTPLVPELEDNFETRITSIDCEDGAMVDLQYIHALKGERRGDKTLGTLWDETDEVFKKSWMLGSIAPQKFQINAWDKDNQQVGSVAPTRASLKTS